jgi:hypothetical protein
MANGLTRDNVNGRKDNQEHSTYDNRVNIANIIYGKTASDEQSVLIGNVGSFSNNVYEHKATLTIVPQANTEILFLENSAPDSTTTDSEAKIRSALGESDWTVTGGAKETFHNNDRGIWHRTSAHAGTNSTYCKYYGKARLKQEGDAGTQPLVSRLGFPIIPYLEVTYVLNNTLVPTTVSDWQKALGSLIPTHSNGVNLEIGTMIFVGPKAGSAGASSAPVQPDHDAGRLFIYVGSDKWICTSGDFHGHPVEDYTTHHRGIVPKIPCS